MSARSGYSVAGVLRQRKYAALTSSTAVTSAGGIPLDGTTPLVSEGTQIFSQAITPIDAAGFIDVTVTINFTAVGTGSNPVCAIFMESTFIGGSWTTTGNGTIGGCITARARVVAGSLAAKTITVRVSTENGTVTFSPANLIGTGNLPCTLTVDEIAP